MKKQLIEVSNLKSYICQANAKIYVDNTMILTPGAKDELNKRKITIIRDAKPETTCGKSATCPARVCLAHADDTSIADMERLFYGVAAMVKEEYGIDDPQQLMDISSKIVNTLKQNI